MKYAGMLAVILGIVSSVSCSKDNVIGTLGSEGEGSSGTGAGGVLGVAGRVASESGGTSNGGSSETSAGTGGGAALAGSTSRGGAAPIGGIGAGTSGTSTGGAGGNAGGPANTGGAGGHIIASAGGVSGDNGVGGSTGTSGMGGRVPSTGGTGGSSPGTGGTGGGSPGTGGGPTGIGGSSFSLGGAAGSGSSAPPSEMGFACPHSPATCNLIHTWTFSTSSQWAGTFVFPQPSITGDTTTDPTVFHVTGTVSDYAGFGIYMQKCTSLAGFTGMTFTLKGTSASPTSPNTLTFVLQTNTDEPIDTENMKGECSGQAGANCFSPNKLVTTSDRPQTVMFSDLTGGKPAALADVTEVIGVYWQIGPGAAPFAIDLSLSDVTLIGPGPMGDCSMDNGSTVPGGSGGSATSN